MKTKLIILILMVYQFANCQIDIEKTTVYSVGTKMVFLPNACNTQPAEAENKLQFCDSQNNLGYVEKSTGLSGRGVFQLLENFHNDDEVFVTSNGFSIRKSTGDWNNIPELALQRNSPTSTAVSVTTGIVHPDGRLFFRHGSMLGLQYININNFQKGELTMPVNYYPYHFTFNDDANTMVFLANSGGTIKMFTLDDEDQIDEISLSGVSGLTTSSKLHYHNNKYYIYGVSGIHILDASFNLITTLNNSNVLSSNTVNAIVFDSNNLLYAITQLAGSIPSTLHIIDESDNSVETFTTTSPTSSLAMSFTDFDFDDEGILWLKPSNYNGVVKFDPANSSSPWENISAETFNSFGFPMTYIPNEIINHHNKLYFLTNDFSSGNNQNFEVAILENGIWTGINDDNPFSLGSSFASRFRSAYPTPNGVWWNNSTDNIIGLIKNDDSAIIKTNIQNANNIITDFDGNPVVQFTNTRKLFYPTIFDFAAPNASLSYLVKYKDQVWSWSAQSKKFFVFRNNTLVGEIEIPNLPSSNFVTTVDMDRNAWFSNYNSSTSQLNIYKFDVNTSTLSTESFSTPSAGVLRKIAYYTDYVAFLYSNALFIYNNNQIQRFDVTSYANFTGLADMVVDNAGDIYVLRSNTARIFKIQSPLENAAFYDFVIEGNNSITPYIEQYLPNVLVLDYQQNLWTQASQNWLKINLSNAEEPYLPSGETQLITGKVYLDANENDAYDDGEEYPNQKVAIFANGQSYTGFTAFDGTFGFLPYDFSSSHQVTLTSFAPFVQPITFQNSIIPQEDTSNDVGLFQLKSKNVKGLVFKTANRLGLWGFERPGFENAFTTVIGNVSAARTYTNLTIDYLYKNEDENSTNVLPEITDVEIVRLTPASLFPLIEHITIEPKSNRWNVSLPPNAYVEVETSLAYTTLVDTDSEKKIQITIPQILPYECYAIRVKTNLFDPVTTGTSVIYGSSRVQGDDAGGSSANPSSSEVFLIPSEESPNLGSPAEFNPYLHPDDVFTEIPFDEPKDFYIPPPNQSQTFSAYDPNDKLVSPGLPNVLNEQDINEKWLYYTVRFENEGNFSAKDVFIIDALDNKLDFDSFSLYESSHPVRIEVLPPSETNEVILKFNFDDIYLDFTSNDPIASQGYVSFFIKAKDSIVEDDIIENNAAIYFDQNPPIVTNTTQNKFVIISLNVNDLVSSENETKVYPNPVKDFTVLDYRKQITGQVSIYTIQGVLVQKINVENRSSTMLDFSGQPSGMYLIKVTGSNGQSNAIKIVKE